MAKKITAKKTGKKAEITVKKVAIDGKVQDLKISTGCKTFGSILATDTEITAEVAAQSLIDINSVKVKGKCINCVKNNPDVAQACFARSLQLENITILAPVKKARGSKKPFDCGIELWLTGYSKAEVISYLIAEKDMGEKPAKRFVNDIFSVGKAAIGQARKKDGLISRYLEWAIYSDRSEAAPEGCKVTLGFCKPYAEIFKEMTI